MTTKPVLSSSTAPTQVSPQTEATESNATQELRIHETFRKRCATPLSAAEGMEERCAQLKKRATLLTHVPVNGLKGTVLFLNMTQIGQAPSPLCPYYNKLQFPTVSTYHTIGSNIACIRLDPSALKHIPKNVLQIAGDLSGKEVDLLWTAIDGRPLLTDNRCFNLNTHPWTHPNALPGDDVTKQIPMGIIPEIGFAQHLRHDAIAINSLSPMRVYSHAGLYSPDNAHFEPMESPFGVLWSITQDGNRVAITKMLVLFDYNHPICQALIGTIRKCDNLATHLERLENVTTAIGLTLDPLITAFENAHPYPMNTFRKLPPAFQEGILKELQQRKGQPVRVDQCPPAEITTAARQFAARLRHLLLDSQVDLLLNSQPLVRTNNVLKMMHCALLFETGQAEEGCRLFETFTSKEKAAVFFAVWELCKSPRGNPKFGSDTFYSSATPNELKKEALLLAASRLTSKFERPIAPVPVEEVPVGPETRQPAAPLPDNEQVGPELPPPPVVATPTRTPASQTNRSSQPARTATPAAPPARLTPAELARLQQVNTEIVKIFDDESLDPIAKKMKIDMQMIDLTEPTKNQIYDYFYDHYTLGQGETKGNPKYKATWVSIRIAKQPDVLKAAIAEIIRAEIIHANTPG